MRDGRGHVHCMFSCLTSCVACKKNDVRGRVRDGRGLVQCMFSCVACKKE